MTLSAELACASRALTAHADRLPEHLRPDLASLWAELVEQVEDCRSEGAATLLVIEWRRGIEAMLTAKLAHAPLVEVSTPRRPTTRGQGRRGVLTPAANERGAP